MKPVWSSLIIYGSTDFNLLDTIEEKHLYMALSKVKGRQFFRSFLSLPRFGMHVIMPSNEVVENFPFIIASLKYLKIHSFNSSRMFLKNSLEKLSGPGALLSLLELIAVKSSRIVYGLSRSNFFSSEILVIWKGNDCTVNYVRECFFSDEYKSW